MVLDQVEAELEKRKLEYQGMVFVNGLIFLLISTYKINVK